MTSVAVAAGVGAAAMMLVGCSAVGAKTSAGAAGSGASSVSGATGPAIVGFEPTPVSTSALSSSPTPIPTSAAATALGSGTQPTGTPQAKPAGVDVPECGDEQMRLATGFGGVGLGHVATVLLFKNVGNSSCYLTGYPGVALTDADNHTLWNAARTMSGYSGGASGYSSPPTVVVAPGAIVSALLEWVDNPAGGAAATPGNCPGLKSENLLVTVPNTDETFSVGQGPAFVCQDFEIHPVVPGTTGGS